MHNEQGSLCEICQNGWNGAQTRQRIFINRSQHEMWYRCVVCDTYWVETERYAVIVPYEQVPDEVKEASCNV